MKVNKVKQEEVEDASLYALLLHLFPSHLNSSDNFISDDFSASFIRASIISESKGTNIFSNKMLRTLLISFENVSGVV